MEQEKFFIPSSESKRPPTENLEKPPGEKTPPEKLKEEMRHVPIPVREVIEESHKRLRELEKLSGKDLQKALREEHITRAKEIIGVYKDSRKDLLEFMEDY